MNNPYILPICFAAAAHGALLFGFTKNPAPVRPAIEKREYTRFVASPEPEPAVVVDIEAGAAKAEPQTDLSPPPRGPEPELVATTSPFTITPPPLAPVSSDDVRQMFVPTTGVAGEIGRALSQVRIVSGDLLDNAPRTRFQASPLYPFQARKEGISGEVWVEFIVSEQGKVMEPRVVKSSHPVFDEPTLRAVGKWQFEPGRRDGSIVKFRMSVPVVFNVNEG